MSRIFIIEDDKIMSECIARAVGKALPNDAENDVSEHNIYTFTNAVEAMAALDNNLPDLIFLDILLSGPNGFSFLNELISYSDTMKIPVVIVTSLDLESRNLSHYGVVKILQKETMTPEMIMDMTKEVLNYAK